MNTSATVGAIAAALAKAQPRFGTITKDKTAKVSSQKATYSYNYADLPSILDAVRGPLSEAEIAILQPVEAEAVNGAGVAVKCCTRLVHSSGEWIESPPLTVMAVDNRPQSVGSAATYARRYSLVGMLSLAADDDDGSEGSGVHAEIAAKPAPATKPAPVESKPAAPPHVAHAWEIAKKIHGDAKKAEGPFKVAVQSRIGSRPSSSMTEEEALDVEAILKEKVSAPGDGVPF